MPLGWVLDRPLVIVEGAYYRGRKRRVIIRDNVRPSPTQGCSYVEPTDSKRAKERYGRKEKEAALQQVEVKVEWIAVDGRGNSRCRVFGGLF